MAAESGRMQDTSSSLLSSVDADLVTAIDTLITAASNRGVETGVILLAVSGGPDSLALLLAAIASAQSEPRRLVVATVDHRLRTESTAEATFVARLCANLGVPHETLVWDGGEAQGNLAAAAREARYRLLLGHARRCGAGLVLTAHHLDDQIETHWLAERRGVAAIDAAGMRDLRHMDVDVLLGRPFLGVPKARLIGAVGVAGLRAVDDPSNRDPAYDRVKIRQELGAGRVDREVLGAGLAHCRRLREAADIDLAKLISDMTAARALAFYEDGAIRLSGAALIGVDDQIARRFLSRLVVAVSGESAPPPGRSIERLHRDVIAAPFPDQKQVRTLGGALVLRSDAIFFMREIGRRGIGSLPLSAAPRLVVGKWMTDLKPAPARVPLETSAFWTLFDGRFAVEIGAWRQRSDATLVPLASLGKGNRRQISQPVLVDGDGRPLAAAAEAGARIGKDFPRLECLVLTPLRLTRDLPQTRSVQLISR